MRVTLLSGLIQRTTTRTRLAVGFLALNAADAALTVYALQKNLGYEGNPLLSGLSLGQLVGVKLLLGILIVSMLSRRREVMMVALCIGIGLVVAWNAWVVFV